MKIKFTKSNGLSLIYANKSVVIKIKRYKKFVSIRKK